MATRSLGTLTLDLIAKIGGFQEGMDKAARVTDDRTRKMEKRVDAFKKHFSTAMKAAGLAVATGFGLAVNEVRKTIDNMAEMQRSAEKIGTSTKQFTSLAYAAKTVHIEVQDLRDALSGMYGQLGNALNAQSDQAKLFKALNINLRDAHGNLKTTTALLKDLADAYVRTGGSAEIMVAGDALMGGDFQKLVPLLAKGRKGIEDLQKQAEELGVTFGDKTGRAAVELQAKMEHLRGAWEGMWQQLAVKLIPFFDKLIDRVIALGQDQQGLAKISSVVEASFRGLMAIGQGLGIVFDGLLVSVKALVSLAKPALDLVQTQWAFSTGHWTQLPALVRKFKADSANAIGFTKESWTKGIDAIKKHWKSLVDDVTGGNAKAANVDWVTPSSSSSSINHGIQKALSSTPTGPTAAKKLADSIEKLQATVRKNIRTTNAELTASIEQKAVASTQAWEAAQKALAKYGTTEQQQVATQKLINEQIAELNQTLLPELIKQHISLSDAQAIVAKKAAAMAGGVKDSTTQMSQFAKQAANNMQDAFADSLFDPFKDGLKGLLGSFIDTLRRMAAQALAARIFDSIGGGTGGGTGGSGKTGWFGSLLGAVFGGGKAFGGTVSSGRLYEVNERRPELLSVGGRDFLMMGAQSGRVDPNPQAVTRARNTVINVAVQPTSTRRTAAQVATAIARQQRLAAARNS